MQIPENDWNNYIKKLSDINQKAGDLMREFIEKNGTDDREKIIQYAYFLIEKYGNASGSLACTLYDSIAYAQNADVPLSEIAKLSTQEEIKNHISRKNSHLQIPREVSRMVKLVASDTILKNAIRDNAEWAWISRGDTCPFCQMLASRGWVRASKKVLKGNHAEHVHANCDCEFAVRFDGRSDVQGYNPNKFKRIFADAKGNTYKEKINYLRRKNYEAIKNERNSKRRERYRQIHTTSLSKQMYFTDEAGIKRFIPKDVEITNVTIIAGKGAEKVLRSADELSILFGGAPQDWSKKTGKVVSDKYIFDIHWNENGDGKQYYVKISKRKEVKGK